MLRREHGPLISIDPAIGAGEFHLDEPVTIGVITGCNGSGKTTTLRSLETYSNVLKPIKRHTTKELRSTDTTYLAISSDEFEKMLQADSFVEAALYGPGYYGTSKDQTNAAFQIGGVAIAEMDLVAAEVFKARLRNVGKISVHLYLLDPFPEYVTTLEERYRFISDRSGRSETADDEEIVRFKKAAMTKIDLSAYDTVISTNSLGVDDVTEQIYANLLASGRLS